MQLSKLTGSLRNSSTPGVFAQGTLPMHRDTSQVGYSQKKIFIIY